MVTFHVIEATQIRGSTEVEEFEDSVHRRYRFVTGNFNSCAKVDTKDDDDLYTGSVSDDVFIGKKPLYVCFLQSEISTFIFFFQMEYICSVC